MLASFRPRGGDREENEFGDFICKSKSGLNLNSNFETVSEIEGFEYFWFAHDSMLGFCKFRFSRQGNAFGNSETQQKFLKFMTSMCF